MTEIWISGKLLCITENHNAAIENLERIVRKAGYDIQEKQEGNKIIKMI
jgi:hypothetical protein